MSKRSKRNKGCSRVSGWRQELELARGKWLHRQVRFFDAGYSQTWQQGEVMEVTTDGDVIVVVISLNVEHFLPSRVGFCPEA